MLLSALDGWSTNVPTLNTTPHRSSDTSPPPRVSNHIGPHPPNNTMPFHSQPLPMSPSCGTWYCTFSLYTLYPSIHMFNIRHYLSIYRVIYVYSCCIAHYYFTYLLLRSFEGMPLLKGWAGKHISSSVNVTVAVFFSWHLTMPAPAQLPANLAEPIHGPRDVPRKSQICRDIKFPGFILEDKMLTASFHILCSCIFWYMWLKLCKYI